MSRVHESCRDEWVISRVNVNVIYAWLISHVDESCLVWMSHVTVSHVLYKWVMSHFIHMRYESCISFIIQICNMTHPCVRHDSFRHVTWLIHMCATSSTWDMNHACVTCECECHTCMIRIRGGWVMSCMNESCLIWMSQVSYEWGMSHMNESCHIAYMHDSYHMWMSRVTYTCI